MIKQLRVLSLSTNEKAGGAATACNRLNRALIESGVSVDLLSRASLDIDNQNGFKNIKHKCTSLFRKGCYGFDKIQTLQSESLFSPVHSPVDLTRHLREREYDILHMHWISRFVDLAFDLPTINKPIVWTMHDMNPFTGGCHYDGECQRFKDKCGACPVLKSSKERDISYKVLTQKRNIFHQKNIHFIAPSKWMADQARLSSCMENISITVLPNPIDLMEFRPLPKPQAESFFQFQPKPFKILFGADSLSEKRKGGYFLKEIEAMLSQQAGLEFEFIVFGQASKENGLESSRVRYLGYLSTSEELCAAYSSCDVLLLPSLQDNLPNIAVESLACGLPIVAFDIGGLPDIVEPGAGYLASPYSVEDIVNGLLTIMRQSDAEKGAQREYCRESAKRYDHLKIASEHLNLYHKLMS